MTVGKHTQPRAIHCETSRFSRVKCRFLSLHAPASAGAIKDEHFVMGAAYALGAALVHHPIGSTAIAVGYISTGIAGVRHQRKFHQDPS